MTFEHSYIFINFEQCQWDTSSILATQQQGIQSFFSLRQKIWISAQGYKWGGLRGVLCVGREGQPVAAPCRSSAALTAGRPPCPPLPLPSLQRRSGKAFELGFLKQLLRRFSLGPGWVGILKWLLLLSNMVCDNYWKCCGDTDSPIFLR